MTTDTTINQDIATAAQAFAAGLSETPEYREYEAASEAYQQDAEARDLLRTFQMAQEQTQRTTAWGGTADDAQTLEDLRSQVTSNAVLSRFFASQENLVHLLKETNTYMTERLGFDFATLTKPAGGCC
ncbi:YlbF family regulator [Alkalispirochaeta americana]|nr:YlbF family regulator [Alkalispirochaeta americana]